MGENISWITATTTLNSTIIKWGGFRFSVAYKLYYGTGTNPNNFLTQKIGHTETIDGFPSNSYVIPNGTLNKLTSYYYKVVAYGDTRFSQMKGTLRTTNSTIYGCFLRGSNVLTKNGMIPIQDLKKNDLVQTLDDDFIPIKFVGKCYLFNKLTEERINAHLYKLNKKDFPELSEDLFITGGHPLLLNEKDLNEEMKNNLSDLSETGCSIITDGKFRVFACIHPKAELWNEEGMKDIYDIVLENEDPHRNYGIWVNGILTESMDEYFFLNYSKMTEINK
jgi:hypothetical protein